jgi:CHAD domain-containing protein
MGGNAERERRGDRSPPHAATPSTPALDPRSTLEELVRRMIGEALDAIADGGPASPSEDDAAAVHRARVATRTVRADLATLRPLLLDVEVEHLRTELAWLGGVLGGARDLDVLEDAIGTLLPTIAGGAASDGAVRLLDRLDVQRRRARNDLRAVRAGERHAALLAALRATGTQPPFRSEDLAHLPAGSTMRPLVRRSWRRVQTLVGTEGAGASDEVLHEVRKRAKRARYAAELAAPVVAGSDRGFAREMERIQAALGALQDAVAAQRWVEVVIASDPTAEEAFVAGMLWTRFDERRHRARKQFRRVWQPKHTSRRLAWCR